MKGERVACVGMAFHSGKARICMMRDDITRERGIACDI